MLSQFNLAPPYALVSWGRVVQPYCPSDARRKRVAAVPDTTSDTVDILDEHLTQLVGGDFLGVHLNPPWKLEESPDSGSVTVRAEEVLQADCVCVVYPGVCWGEGLTLG